MARKVDPVVECIAAAMWGRSLGATWAKMQFRDSYRDEIEITLREARRVQRALQRANLLKDETP
jgi:hypothetical protein